MSRIFPLPKRWPDLALGRSDPQAGREGKTRKELGSPTSKPGLKGGTEEKEPPNLRCTRPAAASGGASAKAEVCRPAGELGR
jgi:hypothetical protein